jgi:hypothetical protein
MAEAQNLEARLGKLEAEQALIASRLNHVDSKHRIGSRMDALRAEALTTQSALGTLTSKLDSQASDIARRGNRKRRRQDRATAAWSAARSSTPCC